MNKYFQEIRVILGIISKTAFYKSGVMVSPQPATRSPQLLAYSSAPLNPKWDGGEIQKVKKKKTPTLVG